MIVPNRAAQNKQRGRMRPAGRQFDMAGLVDSELDSQSKGCGFEYRLILH
jgi:hypothetical protein